MLNGWIKIPRNILNWEWWDKPEMIVLYLYMLSSANEEDGLWHSKKIKRGQFVTSLSSIEHDNPKLTKKIIRTCLKRFQDAELINIESTSSHSVITICNYEEYNCTNKISGKEIKENNQDPNSLGISSTSSEMKETKPKQTKAEIKEAADKRTKEFYRSLIPYVSTYGRDMVREFFDYWSEPNKSGSKLRFEQEKTWDLSRRLARWSNHNKEYKSNGNKNYQSSTTQRIEEATNLVESLLSS